MEATPAVPTSGRLAVIWGEPHLCQLSLPTLPTPVYQFSQVWLDVCKKTRFPQHLGLVHFDVESLVDRVNQFAGERLQPTRSLSAGS